MIPFDAYPRLLESLRDLPDAERVAHCRNLCRTDIYFLLRYVCRRVDMEHPWLHARCQEVGAEPDGYLDRWAREHGKSTIITFGLTLRDLLSSHGEDPDPRWRGEEITVGIFSHTRPVAKGFLRQLKREFETNELLKAWFPDVLWQEPKKEAPKWSEDDGIVLRRKSNPKESTVEAWGLVDGQPTGKHFHVLVYDDVVTRESVSTPEMIKKTTEAMELSFNLGRNGGVRRAIGTRYHMRDTYQEMVERGAFRLREYPATADRTAQGAPVLWTPEVLVEKRKSFGPYTFASQILLDPVAEGEQRFKASWILRWTPAKWERLNRYILVDPASSRKQGADYTAMWVVGLGEDRNLYVLDMVRDRLSLTERAGMLMELHRRWRPIEVRYEEYGLQADVEHIRDRMDREGYRFRIETVGGRISKEDRILQLVPWFEQGRIYLPNTLVRVNRQGKSEDLVQVFIEQEYLAFPYGEHDDMLDALARIADPDLPLKWPEEKRRGPVVSPWRPLDPVAGY